MDEQRTGRAAKLDATLAEPFHMDSSPVLVTRSGTCGTSASETAFASCACDRFSIRPMPSAAATPMNVPWSKPRSRVGAALPVAATGGRHLWILCRVGLSLPVIDIALRPLSRINMRRWDEGELAVGVADDPPAADFVDGVVVEVAQE